MTQNILTERLTVALKNIGLPFAEIHLEHPADESHGDYSSNVAMMLFGTIKKTVFSKDEKTVFGRIKSPRDLAQKIVDELQKDTELEKIISKIEIAGPGFINFWVSQTWLIDSMNRFIDTPGQTPTYYLGEHKKVIFEFAHFNTHKAVHIGHMRNIILGESLSLIYEALGNDVVRLSYGGDVGMHIAKCLYAFNHDLVNYNQPASLILKQKTNLLADAYRLGNNAFEDDKTAKEEIISLNKKIYQKDPSIYPLWKETKEWSIEQFNEIYRRVNTNFVYCYYESEVFERGLEISYKALEDSILTKSDGAIVFKGEKYGLDTRVFVTSEGNPTYEGKELGLAEIEATTYGNVDKIIHVVAPEQMSFFNVTFKVEELTDPELYKDKQYHFVYGYVRLASGKMSSRKGTIILGEWLFDEARIKIRNAYPDISEQIAEALAVSSVKYSFLKIDARQDISFDFDQSISLEGNSGPYLMYTYARTKSVLSKSGITNYALQITNYKLIDEELAILRTLYKYPEVVLEAGKQFAPNLIANYLYDLAQKFNSFYQKVPILKSTGEEKTFRLALTQATAQSIKNGLNLLGIETLEKM